jgi:hypothetical protein
VASYSPVLRAAFNSSFVEGQTQTYNLEVAAPGAFQLLVQWLYTKRIQSWLTDAEIDSLPEDADGFIIFSKDDCVKLGRYSMRLVNLWITADYLQMPRLQNLAVDGLENLRVQWDTIGCNPLNYLCENVPSEAPLRQLIFEHCLLFLPPSVYLRHPHLFLKQMLVDLVIDLKLEYQSNGSQLPQPDPFTDRAEFIKRFHVPEDV